MPHVCLSDSQVALCWIKGIDRDWKPFVQNRVEEIRRLVPARCWKHCPGKDNPADIPSRGLSPTELSRCKLWQDGPEWLRTGIECNQSLLGTDIPNECKMELKTIKKDTHLHVLLAQQTGLVGHVVDSERYSTTRRLYRVTATVLKFIHLLKRQVTSAELSVDDITKAEELWIRESQSGRLQNDRPSLFCNTSHSSGWKTPPHCVGNQGCTHSSWPQWSTGNADWSSV